MKTPLLYRIGRASAAHPFRALAGFVAAVAIVMSLNMAFGGVTQENWDVPGTESQSGIDLLREHVPGAGNADARIVVHNDHGPLQQQTVDDLRTRLATLDHVATVDDARFSADRDTAIIVVGYDVPVTDHALMGNIEPLEKAVAPTRAAGVQVEMNGGVPETAAAPLKGHAEIIGITLALVILVIALGSVVAAGLPILTAIGGLAIASAAIGLLSAAMEVSPSAPLVATMVGLGVGIDYALLVVSRNIEFLHAGVDPVESAARAAATAGRSATFAALTVLISLMGLRLAGLATYSSFGFATAIAVVAMLGATLVVVPAVCRLCGHRLLSRKARRPIVDDAAQRIHRPTLTARWAAAVGRRPVAFGLVAVIVMITLAIPALGMRTWPQDSGAQSTELTTRRAHDLIVDAYGPGANAQITIVAPTDKVSSGEIADARTKVASIPGVAGLSSTMVSPDGKLAVITVNSAYDPAAEGTPQMLAAIRGVLPDGAILTGATTYFSDISDKLQERLWVVIGFVVAASVMLLTIMFRSIAVPIKAALMNLLSVAAAYGVITTVFQWGWGLSLFGIDHTVAVSSWVPILIFAILFGLSMDYEVFLLSRIRENWLATGDAKGSVVTGLARTGRVITSAAAIMVAVFLSFATEADVVLKMLGLGMATAVLLDATLIRMVLVPATMTLLGRFNWWLPGWLDRLLPDFDVEGSVFDDAPAPQRRSSDPDPDAQLQPA